MIERHRPKRKNVTRLYNTNVVAGSFLISLIEPGIKCYIARVTVNNILKRCKNFPRDISGMIAMKV